MKKDAQTEYMRLTWLLIGLCTILRLFYGQAFLLTPDETNYWQWARHLDWSYHDQTPLIGWAIGLSTALFGHHELSVRLPSIIAMCVASIYLARLAQKWFSPRVAWHTALLSQTVLIFNIGGVMATADGLQGACWAAVSYHISCALEERTWRSWLLGGFWLGIGLLSKYTMVLMPACVFLFVLMSKAHRPVLKSPQPYFACLLGLLLFSPVVAWNAAHHWNSFRHVAHLGGADRAFMLHFNFFAEFIGSQAGLLSPLVFLLVIASWYNVIRRRYPSEKWIYPFLFFTSIPVFVGFSLLSLHTRVYANWPCAAYLTAVVLAAAFWSLKQPSEPVKSDVRKIWYWSLITSAALTLIVFAQTVWPVLPIPLQYDRAAHEVVGWDILGEKVNEVAAQMPTDHNAFIFGLTYQDASELAFYTPGRPFTVSVNRWNRPNVYDYWWNDMDLSGKNAIGVLRDGESRKRLLTIFNRVDPPYEMPIHRPQAWGVTSSRQEVIRRFYIYPCYGFKGGMRWIPRKRNDIRVSGR